MSSDSLALAHLNGEHEGKEEAEADRCDPCARAVRQSTDVELRALRALFSACRHEVNSSCPHYT